MNGITGRRAPSLAVESPTDSAGAVRARSSSLTSTDAEAGSPAVQPAQAVTATVTAPSGSSTSSSTVATVKTASVASFGNRDRGRTLVRRRHVVAVPGLGDRERHRHVRVRRAVRRQREDGVAALGHRGRLRGGGHHRRRQVVVLHRDRAGGGGADRVAAAGLHRRRHRAVGLVGGIVRRRQRQRGTSRRGDRHRAAARRHAPVAVGRHAHAHGQVRRRGGSRRQREHRVAALRHRAPRRERHHGRRQVVVLHGHASRSGSAHRVAVCRPATVTVSEPSGSSVPSSAVASVSVALPVVGDRHRAAARRHAPVAVRGHRHAHRPGPPQGRDSPSG